MIRFPRFYTFPLFLSLSPLSILSNSREWYNRSMRQYEKPLKALANKRRLGIIKYLKENKEATVGDIASHIKLSFKATSKHLAVLLSADIVEREQRSLSCFYSITPKPSPIARAVISIV